MSAASPASFWVIAIAGSIAVHGAIGMGLYAMPMPEPKAEARTEITIAAPEVATELSQPPSETVSARATGAAQAAVEPASPALTATDRSEIADRSKPDALAAVEGHSALEPQQIDAAVPEQIATTQLPTAANHQEVVAALEESETAGTTDTETVLEAKESDATVTANESEVSVAQEAVTVEQLIATAEAEPVPSATVDAAPLSELRAAIEPTSVRIPDTAVAPAERLDALVPNGNSETAIPAAQNTALRPVEPIVPASATTTGKALTAPTSNAPVVIGAARPSSNSGVVTPSSSNEDSAIASAPTKRHQTMPGNSSTLAPAPSLPSTVGSSEVISAAPSEDAPLIGQSDGEEQAVAMLPLQDLAPDDLDIPDSSGIRVEDFLEESAGAECLLALPLDPMQASVEAYSDNPDAVHELGAEFMRVAGLDLKTEMRRVSTGQCGALSFARSLPTYPNFPLHLTLTRPEIASGEELSGVVSGLRKDTLYLIVVDDEGKAELVSTSTIGDLRSVEFSDPMTLTSNPGSAVQLLVAIASDGPLRNLPQKPGMPASEYFSQLTFEIIGDNRSIAYGITSFVVK